jgi:hypothetical protein
VPWDRERVTAGAQVRGELLDVRLGGHAGGVQQVDTSRSDRSVSCRRRRSREVAELAQGTSGPYPDEWNLGAALCFT